MSEPIRLQTRDAWHDHVARALVCIVPGSVDAAPGYISSGVTVQTPMGTPFIVTARHVLENERNLRIGSRVFADFLQDPVVKIFLAPDRPGGSGDHTTIDVAVAAINGEGRDCLVPLAVPPVSISVDAAEASGDEVAIAGFVASLARWEDVERTFRTGIMVYSTTQDGCDEQGRLKVAWEDGTPWAAHVPPDMVKKLKVGEPTDLGASSWYQRRWCLAYQDAAEGRRIVGSS